MGLFGMLSDIYFSITILKSNAYLVYAYFSSTLKPRYSEPRNSEFLDKVNKTQLPFWGFIKHITIDIVNNSI